MCRSARLSLTIVMQGFGLGLAFMPVQILAFATLAPELRTEGASLFALLRNIGAAIGVSVTSTFLARNTQALHEVIGASLTPFNRALAAVRGSIRTRITVSRCWTGWSTSRRRLSRICDDYMLLICTTLPALVLLLVMRKPRPASAVEAKARGVAGGRLCQLQQRGEAVLVGVFGQHPPPAGFRRLSQHGRDPAGCGRRFR